MSGYFICPHCNFENKCPCKSCNPEKLLNGFASFDDEKKLICCFSCQNFFHESDSLEIEWERMVEDICKRISPSECLLYIEMRNARDINSSRLFLSNRNLSEHLFNLAFRKYFKKHFEDVIGKQSILRDLKLENLLN